MASESQHISIGIDRPADEVYEYASNPANLPEWAAGLGSSVERQGDVWVADSPMGRVTVAFVEHNDYGVLDHFVGLPSGETVYNPMRVLPDGPASEVIFTLRRRPDMTDDDFARDAAAVSADLATLKRALESR